MAAKPLKLKRERAKTVIRSGRFDLSAQVLIDHDITHLDQPFTYGIPEDLKGEIGVGSKVLVPFKEGEREGFVLEVIVENLKPNKPILRILNKSAYSSETLDLAKLVAHRYATSIVKILRYIPENHATRSTPSSNLEGTTTVKPKRFFEQISLNSYRILVDKLRMQSGVSLILFPSERESEAAFHSLKHIFGDRVVKAFGRSKPSAELPASAIVVGTRASILWQLPSLRYIVIFDEGSAHYWSERNPFWNVRDIALLRSKQSEVDLHIISGAPSLETLRLIELGYLDVLKTSRWVLRRRRRVRSKPDTYHQTIREGLKSGVVLIQTATKEYSSLFLCKTCRSRPRCACGFPLKLLGKNDLACSVCGSVVKDWRCSECAGVEKILISRGAQRIEEELGKAFPFTAIHLSTADKPLLQMPESGIVLATPGMEPLGNSFSALVILDAELSLNRPSMRAEERSVSQWFALLAKMAEEAPVFIDLPSNHRVTQAIISGNSLPLLRALLNERKDVKLPPWYRTVSIKGEGVSPLQDDLKKEFPFLEISRSAAPSERLIRIPIERSQEVIDALYALVKYRSASRKDQISIEIDAFDI